MRFYFPLLFSPAYSLLAALRSLQGKAHGKEIILSHHFEAFRWIGQSIVDTDGEEIGTVTSVHVSEISNAPEFIVVKPEGLSVSAAIPVKDVRSSDRELQARHERESVFNSPDVDKSTGLSKHEETELYSYYGLEAPSA